MNLEKEILAEHSKAQTSRIAKWVGDDKKKFSSLLSLFLGKDRVISQRASWPLYYCVSANPDLIKPHLGKLLKNLERSDIHDAVRRNSMGILREISIPEKHEGAVMNLCFNILSDPAEKAAPKADAISILDKLSKKYPEIRQELITTVESDWEHATPAFRARAKNVLGLRR